MGTQIEVVGDIHLRKTILGSAHPPGAQQLTRASQSGYSAPQCRESWGKRTTEKTGLNTRDAGVRAQQWSTLLGKAEGADETWFGSDMFQVTAEIVLWNSEQAEMLLLRVDSTFPEVGLIKSTVHTVDVAPMGGGWNGPSPAFSAVLLVYLVFHIATVASRSCRMFKNEIKIQEANLEPVSPLAKGKDMFRDIPRGPKRPGCCAIVRALCYVSKLVASQNRLWVFVMVLLTIGLALDLSTWMLAYFPLPIRSIAIEESTNGTDDIVNLDRLHL